ncbi:MAG: protein phosphatase CheZ [Gammaproteobacteria bacterium]|nr:protein phosphatase CheZ [Gammaproteobacteria bacterium]
MNDSNAAYKEDMLSQAEEMLKALQKGNEEQVDQLLKTIADARESVLFQEVGKMTRQLHNTLNSFCEDSHIDRMAELEIPDARERLNYVITMTQEAADRTLNAVEETIPLAETISTRAGELREVWQRFKRRELSVDQFKDLSGSIEEFLVDIEKESSVMKSNLNEVLMAQGFQDLTGQIIKRVITLVGDVENNLVELIRITGHKLTPTVEEPKKDIEAEGPQIPGIGKSDVVTSQGDVDDLLSSLGF